MASKYKSLAALGLSTTLLGGLVACSNETAEPAPAPSETAAPETPEAGTSTTADAVATDDSSYVMSGGEGKEVVAQGLVDDVITAENLTEAFSQSITLDRVDGRFFARRTRAAGQHRR